MDTRLIEKRHYTKDESSAAVLGALELALREMGFEVSVNDDHLVGKRGSILFVRFFGAFFVRRERLPVLVDAQIAGDNGRELIVQVSDNWGWGFRFGLEEVYRPLFADIFGAVEHRLRLRRVNYDRRTDDLRPVVAQQRPRRVRYLLAFAGIGVVIAVLLGLLEALLSK